MKNQGRIYFVGSASFQFNLSLITHISMSGFS